MDNKVELGSLLDIYGAMLTEHQQKLLELYACDDLSLAEIAENEAISRQGARDAIVRAKTQLYEFEAALGMLKKRQRQLSALSELECAIGRKTDDELKTIAARLRGLVEDNDGV